MEILYENLLQMDWRYLVMWAIGGILIPGMVRSGYNKSMSASLVAAAGGIGVIIPPSVAFVVFLPKRVERIVY